MPFDGNGTFVRTNGVYTGANLWASDKTAGINILAKRHDTHDQDIASGLSMCLLKDGTQLPTANIPMGGFTFTSAGAPNSLLEYGRALDTQEGSLSYNTGAHTSDTILFDFPINPTSYSAGQTFTHVGGTANTTITPTINVDSLGAIDILNYDGTRSLTIGEMDTDCHCQFVFDPTTSNKFIMLNKGVPKGETDFPDDAVIETKIADLDDDLVFDTAGKGIKETVGAVTAAGSVQGDATSITALVNDVTGADGTKGVILPAVSAYIGMVIKVSNVSSSALKIYPASGEGFVGDSVNAAQAITGNRSVLFIGLKTGAGTNWGHKESGG